MTQNRGIVLVLDPDEPGQRAAESSGRYLTDLFYDWGVPRYPSEPVSLAIATTQRAIDDLGDQIKALEAFDFPQERLAETHDIRSLLWDYMEELRLEEKVTAFSRATSPEELELALTIEDNPILPNHGKVDYEAIKRNVDIVAYIERDTVLKKSGKNFKGKCPFIDHEDKTASLYIYPETASFYCFGCLRGGDVIEYGRLRGVRAKDIT